MSGYCAFMEGAIASADLFPSLRQFTALDLIHNLITQYNFLHLQKIPSTLYTIYFRIFNISLFYFLRFYLPFHRKLTQFLRYGADRTLRNNRKSLIAVFFCGTAFFFLNISLHSSI